MPRGRKKAPTSPQEVLDQLHIKLEASNEKIAKIDSQLKDAKSEKRNVEKQILEVKKELLVNAAEQSGKTIEEAIEALTK